MLKTSILCTLIILNLTINTFGALPSEFEAGWHLISAPAITLNDFLSTYKNVDKVFTYQNQKFSVKERTTSTALSSCETFSSFNSDLGYWVYANPIFNVKTTGSDSNITINFDVSSLTTQTTTITLSYSTDSGQSYKTTTNISGSLTPSSNTQNNSIIWNSSADIQQALTSVTIKLTATYKNSSGFATSSPFPINNGLTYAVVHTAQLKTYNNNSEISAPTQGTAFYGQDPQYLNNQPSYTNNGDGTVTDNVTGLMWQQSQGSEMTFEQAVAGASTFNAGGYSDWRLPTIKELYSLILFSGKEGTTTVVNGVSTSLDAVPFIDNNVFEFKYISSTERYMDIQNWSSTEYVSKTMNGDDTVFGVNFADGRIKGYPKYNKQTGAGNTMFVRYVRGNTNYGKNSFVDNGDQTVTDNATGLMWMKNDSQAGYNWESALNYCESLSLGGKDDWRLPHAKEIQSLVDYTKSPDTSNGQAALDSVFNISSIVDVNQANNYPYFWTTTTHVNHVGSTRAVYLTFGEALGWMQNPQTSEWVIYDVHGAGSQKSDPKTGDVSNYPHGLGPQGDVIKIENHVRCVRNR
jgi:hypothetical protein